MVLKHECTAEPLGGLGKPQLAAAHLRRGCEGLRFIPNKFSRDADVAGLGPQFEKRCSLGVSQVTPKGLQCI